MKGLLRQSGDTTAVVYRDGDMWSVAIYQFGVLLALGEDDSPVHVEPNQDEAKKWAIDKLESEDEWTPIAFDDEPLPPFYGLWKFL